LSFFSVFCYIGRCAWDLLSTPIRGQALGSLNVMKNLRFSTALVCVAALCAPSLLGQGSVLSNVPPSVRIAEPTNGATFLAPADISIFAVPTDLDGSIQSVEFFSGTNSLGVVTNNPLAMSPLNPWHLFWTNVPPGAYALRAKATDNGGAVGWSEAVRISVLGPGGQQVVNVMATDPDAEEIPVVPPGMGLLQRMNPAVFTISRAGDTNGPLTVFFSLGGTASNGIDYAQVPNSVVIPAGALSTDVTIFPIDDFIVEGTETVILKLDLPVCAAIFPPPADCYVLGRAASAIAYIHDNDTNPPPPIVTVVATDPDASEIPVVPPWLDIPQRIDDGVFRISRTGDTTDSLTVYFHLSGTASNGIDYAKVDESVTIPAGASSAGVVIDPIDDFEVEGTETVLLALQPIDCAAGVVSSLSCYQIGSPRAAVVFIHDNDSNALPRVVITQPTNGTEFTFPSLVHIDADVADADGYVSHVDFFANGVKIGEENIDYFVEPPPGQTATFSFDWKDAAPGRYELVAQAIDNAGGIGVSAPVHIAIIGTNPPPVPIVTIVATDPFASEGGSNGVNTATFVVRRSGPTNESLLVTYRIGGSASNGIDYLELSGSLTIPAGEHRARIVVTPIDDKIKEGPETVVLELSVPPVAVGIVNTRLSTSSAFRGVLRL